MGALILRAIFCNTRHTGKIGFIPLYVSWCYPPMVMKQKQKSFVVLNNLAGL